MKAANGGSSSQHHQLIARHPTAIKSTIENISATAEEKQAYKIFMKQVRKRCKKHDKIVANHQLKLVIEEDAPMPSKLQEYLMIL